MNNNDFEKECIKMRIQFHKKGCNYLLFIMITNISVILMNIPFIYNGTINIMCSICVGMMILSFFYSLSEYNIQRMELKHNMEMKNIYEKYKE